MRLAAVAMIAALSACGQSIDHDAAERAEAQFRMVEAAGGSQADLCDAATVARVAWLRTGDDKQFQRAQIRRDLECARADVL